MSGQEPAIGDFLSNFHTKYDSHLRKVLQNNRNLLNEKAPKLAPSKIGANGRKKKKSKQGKSYFSRPSQFNATLMESLTNVTAAYLDFDDEESEDERLAALNNVEQRTHLVKKMYPRKHKVVYNTKPAKPTGGKLKTRKTVTSVTTIPPLGMYEKIPNYHFSAPSMKNTSQLETSTELIQTPFFDEALTTKDDLASFTLKGADTEDIKERLQKHYEALGADLNNQMDVQEEDRLIATTYEVYAEKMSKSELFETLAKHFQQLKPEEDLTVEQLAEQLEKRYEEIAKRNNRSAPIERGNHFSVQDAWKSFDSLFCIKCKVYDCQQHGEERKVPSKKREVSIVNRDRVHGLLGKMLELSIIQAMVCDSPECYKHTHTQSSEVPAEDPTVNWNDDETVLLLRSIQVLGEELQQTVSVVDPFCALAALAVISCATPKTCKQVRDHLVRWFKSYTPTEASDEQLPTKGDEQPASLPASATINLPRNYTPCKCSSNASSTTQDSCADSNCSCLASMNYCTKWCCDGQCSNGVPGIPHNNCKNFFPGCTCTAITCQTQSCPCFTAGRECDPNICTTCDSLGTYLCHNKGIQRGLFKKIALTRIVSKCADTEVDDESLPKNRFSTLLLEKAGAGELITEFVGELVNEKDLQRKVKYWSQDERNEALVCDVTTEHIIDTHRVANSKIRFIKTSENSAVANVELRNMYVCGDYRLGVYAKRDLPSCTELILDVSADGGRFIKKIEEARSVEKRGQKRPAVESEEEVVSKRKKFTPKRLDVPPPIVVENEQMPSIPDEEPRQEDLMQEQQE